MQHLPSLNLAWLPRDRPLSPCAVAAQGEPARRLAQRLLEYDEPDLAQMQGVAAGDMLLIRGESSALPWAEGVVYLGQDAEAPALLLPTALRPDFPAALLERALRTRFPTVAPPLAILPAGRQVVSLAAARTVARATLLAWLEGRL